MRCSVGLAQRPESVCILIAGFSESHVWQAVVKNMMTGTGRGAEGGGMLRSIRRASRLRLAAAVLSAGLIWTSGFPAHADPYSSPSYRQGYDEMMDTVRHAIAYAASETGVQQSLAEVARSPQSVATLCKTALEATLFGIQRPPLSFSSSDYLAGCTDAGMDMLKSGQSSPAGAPDVLGCGPAQAPGVLCSNEQAYINRLAALGITPKTTPRNLVSSGQKFCGYLINAGHDQPSPSAGPGIKGRLASMIVENNGFTREQASGWVQASVDNLCPDSVTGLHFQ